MSHLVSRRMLLIFLAFAGSLALAADKRPPNIVFILIDDMGYMDIGCNGGKYYETPNIDKLAAQGMRFTNAYAACPVCSPTRASILTGKYPARLNLTDWLPGRADNPTQKMARPNIVDYLPLDETTLAEALKTAGYATASIGKWHIGGEKYFPTAHGFDVNIAGCEKGSPPSYFSPYKNPTIQDGPKGEYLTGRLTDEAVKFIEANKEKPFFIYLPHYTVHNPQQPRPDLLEKYKKKEAAKPGRVDDNPREGARQTQDSPVYAAMVESCDQSVGRIMQKLDELNLADNTIVIFTSDNGGLSTSEGKPTSNEPLRAGKGHLFEGGIREPLIIRWPAVIKPGSLCDAVVTSTDYYPTLLETAGVAKSPQQAPDGVSLLPLLKQTGTLNRDAIYWHYPHYSNQGGKPGGAVRAGDFKLIEFYEDNHVELYNLKDDLSERADLAAKMPEKAKALQKMLDDWRKSVDAKMPAPNPNYDPNAKPAAPKKKPK